MATYTVKLVNHTRATDRLKNAIKSGLQGFFNEVFDKTSDSAVVDWGSGVASDAIVLHFVDDIAASYLDQKWRQSGEMLGGTLAPARMSPAPSSTCIPL
jgi:hypothetical protein